MGWEDFKDYLKIVFIVITIVTTTTAGFIVPIRVFDKMQCEDYAKETGRDTKYSYLTCYVKSDSTWYSMEEFNTILTTKAIAEKK